MMFRDVAHAMSFVASLKVTWATDVAPVAVPQIYFNNRTEKGKASSYSSTVTECGP
jgi:hypothetical protein